MLVGVIGFSIANGTLASILTTFDNKTGTLKEQINILDKAAIDYDISPKLYRDIRQTLDFNNKTVHD